MQVNDHVRLVKHTDRALGLALKNENGVIEAVLPNDMFVIKLDSTCVWQGLAKELGYANGYAVLHRLNLEPLQF